MAIKYLDLMESKSQSSYIIHDGHQGSDRLRILADVTWPYTLPFLQKSGLKRGMKCLDVGCGNGELTKRISEIIGEDGHVTGIDFDTSVIDIAKNDCLPNAKFEVLDIRDEDPGGKYDFIFCRFILSHLDSPEVIIERLKKALTTNGILAVEDVDFRGHFSQPASTAFDQYVRWYEEVSRRKGANPHLGASLLGLLSRAGFANIEVHEVLPAFNHGDGKQMAWLTLSAIKEKIIDVNMATSANIDQILNELKEFTNDKISIISLPKIFQVFGVNS